MGVNGIYGLSGSGLDIESLVKVGMMSKQNEYDKMAQKYTKNEWTKNALVELNNQITTFNMSTLTDYKLSSNMNARTAESSNEAAVTATATAKAIAMPHRIDVEELSSNAYIISNKKLSDIIIANNSNMSLASNADRLSEVQLRDLLFNKNFTNTPTVTSAYSSQTFDNAASMSSVIYAGKNADGKDFVTSTTVNRGMNGAISSITYADGAGHTSTLNGPGSISATTTAKFTSGSSTTEATITRSGNTYSMGFGGKNYSSDSVITYNDGRVDFESQARTITNQDGSKTSTVIKSTTDTDWKTSLTVTDTTTYGGTSTSQVASSYNADGAEETITLSKINASTGNITPQKTATITSNEVTDTGSTTITYTLTLDGKTYTNTDNSNIYTATDGSESTVTLIRNSSDNNIVTGLSIKDVTTYTDGSTTLSKTETVSGTNTSGNSLSVTITTDTDADGKVTTSATTKSVENGYFGSTLGTTRVDADTTTGTKAWGKTSISSGFTGGTTTNLVRDGNSTAISFSISDGVTADSNGNLKTIDIDYSFDKLYKPTGQDENGNDKYFTITDLVADINKQAEEKGLNITATYEYLSDRFFLYNKESGANNQIIITANDKKISDEGDTGSSYNAGILARDFFNTLGLSQSKDGGLTTISGSNALIKDYGTSNALIATGSYAKARVDGVLYDKIENNKLTIDSLGITYNLYQTTTTNAGTANAVDNPVTVTVGQDTSKIIDKVKSFIEDYNKILGSLYEKYDEKPESGYSPLTQSQKDQMKDEQVEKWEEKAKKGLLYHDQTLSKIINQMRNAVTASVKVSDDESVSIFSLGISTTGIKGQLTLNEDKLKAALEKDSEIVYKVFAQPAPTDVTANRSGIVEEDGIAQRLGSIFTSATKLLRSRAGSSADITEDSDLNNLLRELQTKMSNFKKLMSAFEDKLYKKYDAMEVALSKLGSQLNFITGGQ